MSLVRTVAGVLGAVYVVIGILGFIPAFVTGSPPADMPSATGSLLGLFPVNPLHNVVHLVIGAALLYGATASPTAVMVSRGVGIAYLVVGLLGFPFPNAFGLLPLGGADILLHIATAAILLYLGYAAPADWTRDQPTDRVRPIR